MERDAKTIQSHLESLKSLCRDRGMNVTPQRIAVYRALLESEDHPTPDALYDKVRHEMPSISLATIYKSLEALQSLGVCHEISRLGEARRFDANLNHHHHLVCTLCGKVVDYEDDGFGSVEPPGDLPAFIPDQVTVQILGRCLPCAAATDDPDDEI